LEDEIDLRQYILVLVRYWKWIVGAAVGAAVAALAGSFLVSPTYEATALVVVTSPRYVMQFDPRVRTLENVQASYRAYPELAASDDTLRLVLEQAPPAATSHQSIHELRQVVKAELGADPSLIRLAVRSSDPLEAATIANLWAGIFVARANGIYGSQGEQHQLFFEGQMAQAARELEQAQQGLATFQSHNRASILETELESFRRAQAEHLAEQRAVASVIQNAWALRTQLEAQPAGRPLAPSDQLTVMLLQTKAFGVQGTTAVQYQLGPATDTAVVTVGEQIGYLDNLVRVMDLKAAEIEERLAELEPQILATQQELEQAVAEEDHLRRNKQLVTETYMTLARKVDEARIGAEDDISEVQLASRAAVPERPVGPRKLVNTAVAGTIVFLLGTFGALAMAWWREHPATAIPEANDTPQEASLLPIRSVPIK
jgi:polysaccharide biosynthesis transport protein